MVVFTRWGRGKQRERGGRGEGLPWGREIRGIELHVPIGEENGSHAADTEKALANPTTELVHGLRLEGRVDVAVVHVTSLPDVPPSRSISPTQDRTTGLRKAADLLFWSRRNVPTESVYVRLRGNLHGNYGMGIKIFAHA